MSRYAGLALPFAAATMAWPRLAQAATVTRLPIVIGNGWVAGSVLLLFVVVVYMLIRGTMHVEERDARLGRRRTEDGGGWFGTFGSDDDDDIHHHHGGHGG